MCSHLWPSRGSSVAKDHTHSLSEENPTTATPAPTIPVRNPEPLPTAAANHLVHISTLASLDARLAHVGSTQDTAKKEDAPSSVTTDVTFDADTNDFESRLRAFEGELEKIDQNVSRKLEEVVEVWEAYDPVDGERDRYRFGGE